MDNLGRRGSVGVGGDKRGPRGERDQNIFHTYKVVMIKSAIMNS